MSMQTLVFLTDLHHIIKGRLSILALLRCLRRRIHIFSEREGGEEGPEGLSELV